MRNTRRDTSGEISFKDALDDARASATVIVPKLLQLFPQTRSVVDYGCGSGVWTKYFAIAGLDTLGIVGEGWQPRQMVIPEDTFIIAPLGCPLCLPKRYDLALCLDVAQSIPPTHLPSFMDNLALLADIVVFSADAPGQGGENPENEQWPYYWIEEFKKRNYGCFDVLRPIFWRNTVIEDGLRQNILLFVKNDKLEDFSFLREMLTFGGYPIIMPDIYARQMRSQQQEIENLRSTVMSQIENLGRLSGVIEKNSFTISDLARILAEKTGSPSECPAAEA